MKRILKLMMLPLALMVSLTGCGNKPTAEPTVEPTQQPTGQPSAQPVEKHTVQFYVEDTLYR